MWPFKKKRRLSLNDCRSIIEPVFILTWHNLRDDGYDIPLPDAVMTDVVDYTYRNGVDDKCKYLISKLQLWYESVVGVGGTVG